MGSDATLTLHPAGGLANRMRAMVSGIMLARALGRRIDIRWPVNPQLHCPFHSLFDADATGVAVTDVSAMHDLWLDDIPRKKNLFLTAIPVGRWRRRMFSDNNDEFIALCDNPEEMIAVMRSEKRPIAIRSGLQFFDFTPDDYRHLIRPLPVFHQRARELLSTAGHGVIGLHIRRTDNLLSIRESPTTLFEERIRTHLDAEPSLKFFLATDDEAVKRHLRAKFGPAMIIAPQAAVRNTTAGILNALTEMVALSHTRLIYGSYWSSFSEAASLLGNIPLTTLRCT